MTWIICMYLSYGLLFFLLGLSVWSFLSQNKIEKLSKITFAGVFLSAVIMFYPCYIEMFRGIFLGTVKTFLACIHHTIRLFIVDGELTFVINSVTEKAPLQIVSPYIALASIIFIISPIFTFGFILSFFKSISAFNHYLLGYKKDKYIFSIVNESTLSLAEDIRANHPSSLIIFADTDEKELETHYNYFERLKNIKAVCFKKDITTINISFSSSRADIKIFLFSLDENANHKQAVIIRDKYYEMPNVVIYVHSVLTDNELMPTNKAGDESTKHSKIKIRSVNDVRLLINNILYNKGHLIFDNAVACESGKNRVISAIVVGMGNHGTEMMKALPSFCQMNGYLTYITAIDINFAASSVFSAMCPELMDETHNGDFVTSGEAHYKINFYDGIDVCSSRFTEIIKSIPKITYVFISLGNDSLNITTAKKIRAVCAQKRKSPTIQAVVYDSEKTEILRGNKTAERYGIDFVGDIKTFYTEEVIMASEVETAALKRHLKWGSEDDFWNSEYNYRSSVASVIHRKMKEHCHIPHIKEAPENRDDKSRMDIRVLEHQRWNAYMRSEGYVYGKTKNHILKTHCDLVPFFELSPEAQAKDDE